MKYPKPRPQKFATAVKRGVSGLGLFAKEDIPKNRFVIEYWGDIMSDDDAQYVGGRYLFELGNGKTVNGASRHNDARYINHACRPNSEVRIMGNRIYIFSIKNIKAGDELTYDYGKEYWNYYIKPHGCRCITCVKRRNKTKAKN